MRRFQTLLFVLILAVGTSVVGQTLTYGELITKGFLKKHSGDLDGAIDEYTKAIALDPFKPDAFHNRGIARSDKNDIAGAMADYNKAIEVAPKISASYVNRGNLKKGLNDINGARSDFDVAVTVGPDDAYAFYARGSLRQDSGDHSGAIADLSKCIELDSKFSHAYLNRGISKSAMHDLIGAVADFSVVVAQSPEDPKGYYNRGLAYLNKNDLGESQSDLDKAAALTPNDADVFHALGAVKFRLRDLGGAINALSRANKLAPRHTGILSARGTAYAWFEQYDKAIADYDAVEQLDSKTSPTIAYTRAWARFYMDDSRGTYRDVLQFLNAKGVSTTSSPYAVIIGYLALARSDRSEAVAFAEGWYKLLPKDNWTTKIISYLLGHITERQLLSFARDTSAQTEAYTYMGKVNLLNGEKAAARSRFEWVRANGSTDFREFHLAGQELKRLTP